MKGGPKGRLAPEVAEREGEARLASEALRSKAGTRGLDAAEGGGEADKDNGGAYPRRGEAVGRAIMKIEAARTYRDTKLGRVVAAGEEIDADKERADLLVGIGYARKSKAGAASLTPEEKGREASEGSPKGDSGKD